MSHEATSWAVRQRGISPTTKVVLWHLADRHNPDYGCFPSQDRLAEDAEISRSGLNNHLNILEQRGLIRREKRVNDRTKRQMSTRYILAFEPEFAQDDADPCPEYGHGTEMEHPEKPCPEFGHGPCPKNGESRVQNLDTNLVREPLRVGGGSACAREAPDHDGFPSFRERLLEAMGVGPDGIAGPSKFIGGTVDMAEAARWLDLPGMSQDVICAEVRAVMGGKRDGPPSSFRYFTSAMQRLSAALSAPPLQPASPEDLAHERPASRDRRAAAADDAFAERIAFAARNRSPSRPDFGFG